MRTRHTQTKGLNINKATTRARTLVDVNALLKEPPQGMLTVENQFLMSHSNSLFAERTFLKLESSKTRPLETFLPVRRLIEMRQLGLLLHRYPGDRAEDMTPAEELRLDGWGCPAEAVIDSVTLHRDATRPHIAFALRSRDYVPTALIEHFANEGYYVEHLTMFPEGCFGYGVADPERGFLFHGWASEEDFVLDQDSIEAELYASIYVKFDDYFQNGVER